MAKDDYYVIVYKILAYLYKQLKNGQPIEKEMLIHNGRLFTINETYWVYADVFCRMLVYIFQNMLDQGFIRGINNSRAAGGFYIAEQLEECEITPEGIGYLCDNNLMEKAKRFLKDIKDITPFI